VALHKKKVLFITTGIIILVVFAGILGLLLNLKAFKPQIEAAASAALGMDVRIKGRTGIALFSGFGLSGNCRWRRRPSCSGRSSITSLSAWARPIPSRSMYGSWQRPIETLRKRSARADSGRTFTIGSTSSPSPSPHYGNGKKTSRCWSRCS